MATLRYGEWLPDRPALGNPGVMRAENAFPASVGYLPVPSWQASTDALAARPRGAIRVRDFNGVVHFFAGDETALYELLSGNWTDASKVGGYATPAEERWELIQFGNLVLATNFGDPIQQINVGVDADFSDLTTDFQARHIASVRNFVLAGNTTDVTDGEVRNRLRWSGFNQPASWTPDPVTLADFTDLQTGGEIRRIMSGELGVVLQENSIRRMLFVGAPVVFQIDEVLPGTGLLAPGAVAQSGREVYCLSTQGFLSITDGAQIARIGAEKVDQFVRDDLDTDHLHRISAAMDISNSRVAWAYPGAANIDGRPNRVIIYDVSLQKWSLILYEAELLWEAGGVATLLDDISDLVDDVEVTLDSSSFKGSGINLGAFGPDWRSGAFDGPPMTALIETGEVELNPDRRTRLSAFRSLVEGGTTTARVASRSDLEAPVLFGPTLSKTASGRFTTRTNHFYNRVRLSISGSWTRAIGLQVGRQDARPGSTR